MNRPLPVTLSAILLGLLAALELFAALGMVAAGFLFLHKGFPAPPPTPYPPSFLPIVMFAMSLFFVALAVWSILTLIGLVRLRSWARYSVLVIAGCLAFFAGMGSLMSFAMPFLASSVAPPTPDASPALMHGVFFVVGAFYALFAAIGIALLVYFNLAKTRALFLQNAPVNLAPPNTCTGRPRPIAITILSWFLMISTPFCGIYAFFPLPAFFFGYIVYGLAAHLVFATFAIMGLAIGIGLLRLRWEARIAAFAWLGIGFLNMFAILTPWGSRNFRLYMDKFAVSSSTAPTPIVFNSTGFVLLSCLFGAAINLFLLWLLHRHRDAFTPAPPAPPLPADL
jgi:hypothetical protein